MKSPRCDRELEPRWSRKALGATPTQSATLAIAHEVEPQFVKLPERVQASLANPSLFFVTGEDKVATSVNSRVRLGHGLMKHLEIFGRGYCFRVALENR